MHVMSKWGKWWQFRSLLPFPPAPAPCPSLSPPRHLNQCHHHISGCSPTLPPGIVFDTKSVFSSSLHASVWNLSQILISDCDIHMILFTSHHCCHRLLFVLYTAVGSPSWSSASPFAHWHALRFKSSARQPD